MRLLGIALAALAGAAGGATLHKTVVAPETGGTAGRETELVITAPLSIAGAGVVLGLLTGRHGWIWALLGAGAAAAALGDEADKRVTELLRSG